MKKITQAGLFLLVILTAGAVGAQTQEEGWQLDSLTVGAGQDALSSGIRGSLWLANEQKGQMLEFSVQEDQGYVLWGRQFDIDKVEVMIAGSAGHFLKVPWIGPQLTATMSLGKVAGQKVTISTFQWLVYNAWEPDRWKYDGVENPEALNLGFVTSYGISIGPVGIVYSLLNFLDDPWNELPSVSYTQEIRKDFSITGSVTRNGNAEEWMFFVGAAWKPGA